MLNETMANYIEAQVLEKMYGKTMVRRLANFSRRRYFNFKSSAAVEEPSLHLVDNETYISYRKGFLTMQSLKELIGQSMLNTSLKDLIDTNQDEQSARSIDFINLLLSKVDSEKQDLIEDWFKKTYDTPFDFEIEDALGKLKRLKLCKIVGNDKAGTPIWTAVSLAEACKRLDMQWDNFFQMHAT